jgi:hypothetical protein
MDQGRQAGKVVGNAAETDRASLRLKVHRPLTERTQVRTRGSRIPQAELPERQVAPQIGDELRALVPRWEPATPDTDWVAHEL